MRLAALFASLSVATVTFAGGSSSVSYRDGTSDSNRAAYHVKIEVEADHLVIPVRVTLRGKDRAALDVRLDAIKAALTKRFENQEGYEAQETSFGYSHAIQTYARSSSGSKSTLFGDEEDKSDVTYEASASWNLLAPADKGAKSLEILRAKADGLVNPKAEGEKQQVGEPTFRLADAEGYRNDLLDAIKGDFEEVKKHLPANGEYRLQLPGLEKPVQVSGQGGRRFLVELPYAIAYVTPEPEKAKK